MANTHAFKDNRSMRKGIKRSQRKALKALKYTLTNVERRQLRKEPQGIKAFVAEQGKVKEAAAAAAAEKAAAE